MQDNTTDSFEAQVIAITGEKTIQTPGSDQPQLVQSLELEVATGTRSGQIIQLENGSLPLVNNRTYQPGDELVITASDGNYYISDIVRRPSLILLFALFLAAAIIVGRRQGLTALLGLGASFLIIFFFVLPQIAAGANPILIVILACLVIIPLMFALSHGFNKKTLVAMIATLITLLITGLLIVIFVGAASLTGFSSEEAMFIAATSPNLINFQNLLIAGMLIATLGVLDDITISQAGIVAELKKTNPNLGFKELYKKAMRLGRDHIASMINTLILVYAGASFPLLLLFIQSEQALATTINYEIIADEIVRTLTGSLGLIIAVPLTTLLAAWTIGWGREQ